MEAEREEERLTEEDAPKRKRRRLPLVRFAVSTGGAHRLGGAPHCRNGRCTGDCAHCPPHYGYRYGRWYYGRDHVYGCEFGGNKGSGGL